MDDEKNSSIYPPPIEPEEIEPTFISRGLAFSKRTFSSLQSPKFRIYYAANLLQQTSMNMQVIARSLLIYRITDSATILGMMALAFALPMLILSYYGGSLADRFPKRTVMLFGYAVSTLMAILVGIAIRIGYVGTGHGDSWWLLMVTAVIQGIAMALTTPSRQSIVAELVPAKHVQNAVALNTLAMNAMRMVGPAVAGFVIEFAGFDTVFFISGGLSFVGWLSLWFLPALKQAFGKVESTLLNLKEGLSYVRHDLTVMLILAISVFVFTFGVPYLNMMPIFSDDILKVGASGMGLLLTVNGIGAVLGSLVMAGRIPRNRGKILLWSILIMGLGIIGFSFSTMWYLSLALMFLTGITIAFFGAATLSLLLNYTQKEYHGRVMSIFMMQEGLVSLGATMAGVIADSIGSVQWAVAGMAVVLPITSLTAHLFVKKVRRLD